MSVSERIATVLNNKRRVGGNMAFYEYTQNNSGGHFEVNDKLCDRLFIEADTFTEADSIAEDLGVYFNGVYKGIDCGCCGDRWSRGDEIKLSEFNENGYEVPMYDGMGDIESAWQSRYGAYEIHTEPRWKKTSSVNSAERLNSEISKNTHSFWRMNTDGQRLTRAFSTKTEQSRKSINESRCVMFTQYELVTIYEALAALHPNTRAQFKADVEVSVSDLSAKVLRLINEKELDNHVD